MLSTAHRYFLEVVRAGSIKDAAAALHVAPSAISRQIAKLEEGCGAALFERRPHGMELTRAGEMLADYARRVAMDAEHVLRDIRSLRHAELTTIRIGSNEAVARNVLPPILGAYRSRNPGVAFQVHVASPGVVTQRLRDGSIDVGLAFSLNAGSGIDVRYEIVSPVRAIMVPGHPLAGRGSVSLEDLRQYPIALTDSGTTVRLLFDSSAAGSDGPPFDVAYSSNSSSVIRAVVEAGHAVTLAGEITLAEPLRSGALVALALQQPIFAERTLQVQTASHAQLPETTDAFVLHLIEALSPGAHQRHS
ncbi:LysR family transcriptional regulator [Achromobacter insolitus]|jgi:DNA-binding transcriptional LysR family regulator|uniref:HTH-type transcriptional regulator GltC n=1 Tax=Achromobacter insolitus TaxID=217204 RepID=A0A6S7F4N4_9BURK|nr:LysR family transcriptional regulator [Achromobacter insolitus]QEK90955.1 LysR family transcriptional regulator [Achromobacter insolitus]CAB3935063.1 HTH-type transcriptional regulator GltC [Achromobacter insolitus]CAB3941700.1 HTH-type transcriptional regulator GltC [Achromobacter insolitus]